MHEPVVENAVVSESTLLTSLVVVARHRGIHLSLPLLIRQHQLGSGEPTTEQLLRVARASGLRAAAINIGPRDLEKLRKVLPAIVLLRGGGAMVLLSITIKDKIPQVTLQDPTGGSDDLLTLDAQRFSESFSGEIILVKRNYRETNQERPFGWGMILGLLARDRGLTRDIAIAALILGLLSLAPIMFWRTLLDSVLNYRSFQTFYVLIYIIVILIAFETAFTWLRRYMVLHIARRFDVTISTYVLTKLLDLPVEYFERTTTGEITHNMNKFWDIRGFIINELLGTLLDGMIVFIILPILFLFSPLLTSVVVFFAFLICAWLLIMRPVVRRKGNLVHRAEAMKGAFMVETLYGIRTVKSLALDSQRLREWDTHVAKTADLRLDEGRTGNLVQTVVVPLERMMTSGVFALAVYLTMTENTGVTVGGLVAFIMLTMRMVQPLSRLAMMLPEYDEARVAVEVIAGMVNQPPEEARLRRGVQTPIIGRVEFNRVRFRYSGSNVAALDDVSFTIPEGTIFGVVGRSGSGKTTVTRLLQQLHTNYEGLIKIDGSDFRVFDVNHLRASIGIVLQENFLFRGTIRDTIAAGKSDATYEEVITAARLAGAEEFIERMPRGYDTWLQEGSTNLSGGQRQRLAIARALITNPRILILDEATSALDAESEAIINANLLRIAKQRTLIVISHRLSSLVDSDAILVLDAGKVLDIGTHQELVTRCDVYRSLWQQQHRHILSSTPHEVTQPQPRLRSV